MPADNYDEIKIGTYEEIASWLEDGGLGVATDLNNILFAKQQQSHTLLALTSGFDSTVPKAVSAAYQCVPGDCVVLNAGGLPTLPSLVSTAASGDPLSVVPGAWPAAGVRILNTTAAAINVAAAANSTVNGGATYALAAGTSHLFRLDATGANWVVF